MELVTIILSSTSRKARDVMFTCGAQRCCNLSQMKR